MIISIFFQSTDRTSVTSSSSALSEAAVSSSLPSGDPFAHVPNSRSGGPAASRGVPQLRHDCDFSVTEKESEALNVTEKETDFSVTEKESDFSVTEKEVLDDSFVSSGQFLLLPEVPTQQIEAQNSLTKVNKLLKKTKRKVKLPS